MTTSPRAPLSAAALVLAAAALLLTACGEAPSVEPRAPVRWSVGKPNPVVGRLQAAVIERPAPDRAWVEARYERRGAEPGCALEMLLADGVVLLEGEARQALAPDEASGSAAWLLEFPTGAAVDALIRLCVETSAGMRSCEVVVNLAPGPERPN